MNERVLNERDASYCVCVEDVVIAVKSGKSSGEEGINSDHLIINAPHRLIFYFMSDF